MLVGVSFSNCSVKKYSGENNYDAKDGLDILKTIICHQRSEIESGQSYCIADKAKLWILEDYSKKQIKEIIKVINSKLMPLEYNVKPLLIRLIEINENPVDIDKELTGKNQCLISLQTVFPDSAMQANWNNFYRANPDSNGIVLYSQPAIDLRNGYIAVLKIVQRNSYSGLGWIFIYKIAEDNTIQELLKQEVYIS